MATDNPNTSALIKTALADLQDVLLMLAPVPEIERGRREVGRNVALAITALEQAEDKLHRALRAAS